MARHSQSRNGCSQVDLEGSKAYASIEFTKCSKLY
jgi:hypothetical protein